MSRWPDRIKRVIRHPGDAWLLARVVVLGAIVHPLVHRIGVARAARLARPFPRVGRRPPEGGLDSRRVRILAEFADPQTSNWTEGACLERSLILYRLLNVDGIPVDLVIGLRSERGKVDGHAWLAYQGRPVLERSDPLVGFQPTLRFASPYEGSELPFPEVLSQPL